MNFDNADMCAWTEERLELFLDGELSGSENLRFQTHLKECDDCAAYWADDEVLSEALLVAVAPDLESHAPFLDDSNFVERVLDDRDERPITHHSSSVVVVSHNTILWASVSALAASLITVAICYGLMQKGTTSTPKFAPAVEDSRAQVEFAQGEVFVRHSAKGEWRPLQSSSQLTGHVALRTDSDSRALLRLDGELGQILVAEKTEIRLHELPTANSQALVMELDCGRISCDLGEIEFRAGTIGIDLNGDSAAFDLTCGDGNLVNAIDARLAVTRGDVMAQADIGAERQIREGEVFVVKEGLLIAFERLSEIEDGGLAIKPLRPTAKPFLDRGVSSAPFNSRPSQSIQLRGLTFGKIDQWLRHIVETGHIDLVSPDEETRLIFKAAQFVGDRALQTIKSMFAKEIDPLKRKALVGLVGVLGSDKSNDFLCEACHDSSLMVRKAAVLFLSRDASEFGSHFLAVCEKEEDRSLRLSMAFLAAMAGETRGLDEMITIYNESRSISWRKQTIESVARVRRKLKGRAQFLRDVIVKFASHDDAELISLAVDGLRLTDQVSVAQAALISLVRSANCSPATATLVKRKLRALGR